MRCGLALGALLWLGGCATLVNGPNEDVAISSTPTGAKVFVDGDLKGRTPLTVPMSRRDYHDVRIELAGHDDYQETIGRTWSPWLLGNLCPLGPLSLAVGSGVDYATGGGFKLAPTVIDAELASAKR